MPVGRYIVDFACIKAKLIVELDGGQHAEGTYDDRRTEFLLAQGWRVLRFWNNEVIENLEGVLMRLASALGPRLSRIAGPLTPTLSPTLTRGGEGEERS